MSYPVYHYPQHSGYPSFAQNLVDNHFRSHVDAIAKSQLPIEFLWLQAIRIEKYKDWHGTSFSPLPAQFTRGTTVRGSELGVIGECEPCNSFQLYYGTNLLVLEFGVGYDGPDKVRLCLDEFLASRWQRFRHDVGKQRAQAKEMLQRFLTHCEQEFKRAQWQPIDQEHFRSTTRIEAI